MRRSQPCRWDREANVQSGHMAKKRHSWGSTQAPGRWDPRGPPQPDPVRVALSGGEATGMAHAQWVARIAKSGNAECG